MKRAVALLLALLTVVLTGCRAGTGGGEDGGAGPGPAGESGASPVEGVAWSWEAPPKAFTGMPAADDREVAFTYGHQYLVVLDAGGRERWQAARLGLRDVAPRLGSDLVVAATDDGLAAFRR